MNSLYSSSRSCTSAVVVTVAAQWKILTVRWFLVIYLCSTVSKLGQDFGSVVGDDAHGVTGQVEFLQTGQRADVPDLLQLETDNTCHKQPKSTYTDSLFHRYFSRVCLIYVSSKEFWGILCLYWRVDSRQMTENEERASNDARGRLQYGYLSQLVVAEVQIDQRVELCEAGQLVQLVASQAESFYVA